MFGALEALSQRLDAFVETGDQAMELLLSAGNFVELKFVLGVHGLGFSPKRPFLSN
jgi:hypothetical protein